MSNLFTGSDLNYITSMQGELMPDLCTLRAVTNTSDGSGGWTEGTSDTANVPCRLMMNSGSESVRANQVTAERSYILTIPKTYTITPRTRVIKAGVTYEVVSVNDGSSYVTALRATCVRVE